MWEKSFWPVGFVRDLNVGASLLAKGPAKIDEDPELVYTCGELSHRQKVRTNKSAAICTRPGENHRHA